MKVYGTPICIHCRHYKAIQKERGFEAEFIDITKNTDNLKKFLAMRDEEPLFEQVKKNYGIGIPFFVNEDGRKTFDLNEALSWMGEKPVDPKAVFEEGGKKDLSLDEKYEFRNVRNGEAEEAAALEAACFPANEACTLPIMRQRVSVAADLFVVAVEKSTGKIAGFVNAIATNENTLRDEFFTDIRSGGKIYHDLECCRFAGTSETGTGAKTDVGAFKQTERSRQGRFCSDLCGT